MTVASELIKLKDNLTGSYTAVENKGGTLPQHQNFDNLPDAIDSITTGGTIDSLNITPTTSQQIITASGDTDGYSPITVDAVTSSIDANITAENIKDGVEILGVTGNYQGSGGDTLYADNRLGRTPVTDEKVLLTRNTTTADSYSNTESIGYYYSYPFIMNDKFYKSNDYDTKLYVEAPGTWSIVETYTGYSVSFGGNAGRRYAVHQNRWYRSGSSNNRFAILSFEDEFVRIEATNATFLKLNDSLKFKGSDGKIYSNDESQSYDTGLGAFGTGNYNIQLFGNTLACLKDGYIYFIDITNFPSCIKTTIMSNGPWYGLGFTGVNEGDFLATVNTGYIEIWKYSQGTYSVVKRYECMNDSGSLYTPFLDCDTHVLCFVDPIRYPHTIILENGAVVEKEIPNEIKEIIHSDLLLGTYQTAFKLHFQSDKALTKFAWSWSTGNYSNYNRFCQAKADGVWYITESTEDNYQPLGSFTAYITGNTNLDGDYEVKTLLPKIDTIACTLEVSDNTIIPIVEVEEI